MGRRNIVGDFWSFLELKPLSIRYYRSYFNFKLHHKTDQGYLNVTTFRDRYHLILPIYTILITNNEPPTERDKRAFHKDAPGHVTTSQTFYTFRRAIRTHLAALHRLNERGY